MSKITIYPAFFSQYGEGKYQARFPDFDDMVTGGEDFHDAYRMAVDLLAGRISWMEEDGDDIPAPSAPETLKPDPDEFLVMVSVDIENYHNKVVNRMIPQVVEIPFWATEQAKEGNLDLSALLTEAIKTEFERKLHEMLELG